MEVATPVARSPDFRFVNTTFSPYLDAPSSPVPFGDWFNHHNYLPNSAPSSPTHFPPYSPIRFDRPASPRPYEKDRIRPLRNSAIPNSSRIARRKSRSLSPSRERALLAKHGSSPATPVKSGLSKKWPRLKNLLLFRSASEGRVTGIGSKDPLQKCSVLPSAASAKNRGAGEDKFKAGGGEMVRRRSRPAVSPHERLYTANRAAAEEQKRRTPLPFQRHGLLGLVDLSPAIRGKPKVASPPKGIL